MSSDKAKGTIMDARREFYFSPILLILSVTVAMSASPVFAESADAIASERPPVREAAARYGQALGVAEVCFGSKITSKAEALPKSYSGAEGETFKAQAGKIFDAWLKVKSCVRQDDPNQCKIIMDKSCLAAEAEIGPKGSAFPGLVEFASH